MHLLETFDPFLPVFGTVRGRGLDAQNDDPITAARVDIDLLDALFGRIGDVPKGVTIIYGDMASGKSTIAASIICELAKSKVETFCLQDTFHRLRDRVPSSLGHVFNYASYTTIERPDPSLAALYNAIDDGRKHIFVDALVTQTGLVAVATLDQILMSIHNKAVENDCSIILCVSKDTFSFVSQFTYIETDMLVPKENEQQLFLKVTHGFQGDFPAFRCTRNFLTGEFTRGHNGL